MRNTPATRVQQRDGIVRVSYRPLDCPSPVRVAVAFCGKCDTGLAPGNRLIPAETDPGEWASQDLLKLPPGQGSSRVETSNSPFSRLHP
jgi:hypothetical protein